MLAHSAHTAWYRGPTLMGYLETVDVGDVHQRAEAFRMPVQWVNRPNLDFRGFSGTIASGAVRPGDRLQVQPSGRESTVARIVTADGDLALAVAGQSITLTLADEIDVSRGAILSNSAAPAEVADQFEATLVWMAEAPLLPGRQYLLKIGAQTVTATASPPKYKFNVNTMEHLAATQLELNEIGVCNIALDRAIAFDPYTTNRDTGGFILIDRLSNGTVGAGMLHFALHRAPDGPDGSVEVDKAARAQLKGQKPCVLWFAGPAALSLARRVEQRLFARGRHTHLLGHGTPHRAAELAPVLLDAGLIVLFASPSPDPAGRVALRSAVDDDEFIAIEVDPPPGAAALGDPPSGTALCVQTTSTAAEDAADRVLALLFDRGVIR